MSSDRQTALILGVVVACQCRADSSTTCGRPHKPTGGTCPAIHTPHKPLHVIPRADVPPELATTLPPEELMVMCDACHAALLAMRRKTRRTRAVPVPEALF
ncbi:hypothetical protein ABZU75_19685 [Streptosporangium sp. NPDC005286]|uniref:hypothetical protein n=1 Tax=Streptosporangium sp. NPDC005286 TaxID=3154463 RepID=UPI0033B0D4EB